LCEKSVRDAPSSPKSFPLAGYDFEDFEDLWLDCFNLWQFLELLVKTRQKIAPAIHPGFFSPAPELWKLRPVLKRELDERGETETMVADF